MDAKHFAKIARNWFWVWASRLALIAFCIVAVAVIYFTNALLTERYTEATRNRAEVRLTLYAGNLISELQRNSIVPQLLSRDQELINALRNNDFSTSSQRLLSFVDEIGAASLMMFDRDGRIVAATDRNRLGENHRGTPYFLDALRSNQTVFTSQVEENGAYAFAYSRRIEDVGTGLGVIVVEVDLRKLQRGWASISDAVFVTDSEGRIILSTEGRWRGKMEEEALATLSPAVAIERSIQRQIDWTTIPIDAFLRGDSLLRREMRIPFQGWRIVGFTTYASVRERVNGILALEIMGFAILLSVGVWLSSRKTASRMVFFQRESAELRKLNIRMQREIAERQKVERTLEVAEQTLAQSSKLAALGEMSAAVSHELNQPLAAMKTYLAGARLLLTRNRPQEALASFHRIDDLIDRMGAITRQLKSYARKGAEKFSAVDAREAVISAISMMEPQLRSRKVEITRTLPNGPAMIYGDRLRLEQVIVNLLRNALDATKSSPEPRVDVILAVGETVHLMVRDNGPGIEDLDALFEPFYTTKQPGDGVGLGLAISSGIVGDLGGRLTARNGSSQGAVFEVELPIYEEEIDVTAAE